MSISLPPPGGWTIAEAAKALLPDLYAAASRPCPKDWWMTQGAVWLMEEREALRLAFVRLMKAPEYSATGFAPKAESASTFPPDLWRASDFDLGLPGQKKMPGDIVFRFRVWTGVRVKSASQANLSEPPWPMMQPAEAFPASTPAVAELPAWWTLDQACVWISLRDTDAVLEAGPPRYGHEGNGIIRFHLEWALRSGNREVGPNPSEADESLLSAARREALRSRGKPHTADEPRDMISADWALVTIAEDSQVRGAKYLAPLGFEGLYWRGVLVARDDLVREWPPFGAEARIAPPLDPAEPAMAPAVRPNPGRTNASEPRPESDPQFATHEYQLRVLRWQKARRAIPNLRSPSPQDDEAWAKARFGQLSRATLRALRTKHAPKTWREPGKRAGVIWQD